MPSFRQQFSYKINKAELDMAAIGRYDLSEPSRAEPIDIVAYLIVIVKSSFFKLYMKIISYFLRNHKWFFGNELSFLF